jgi:phospholipid transport system substrate-binding protein
MSFHRSRLGLLALGLLASLAGVQVAAKESTPYAMVQDTTKQVMEVVAAADVYVETDPERYYQQVQDIFDPLVDFRGFARRVMGPYASSDRYRSLDEAGREQLKGQLDRFTGVMRLSLVRTYSKGLLAFGDSRIEVAPPEEGESGEAGKNRVSVSQLVYADRSQPYEVLYQMGQGKSGDWKLLNVIIESVNLGEVYRDQFLASAREQDGNLDTVIDGWTTVVVDVDS